jgi:hypothetical protein
MRVAEAIRIVETLADGRDPSTGTALPPESVYQQPQIIRALYTVVQELKRLGQADQQTGATPGKLGVPAANSPAGRDADKHRARTPSKAGKAWTPEEEAELLREFEKGASVGTLAKKHGRTAAAIYGRLYLLGKVPAYVPPARKV